jgi:hypothetical protein
MNKKSQKRKKAESTKNDSHSSVLRLIRGLKSMSLWGTGPCGGGGGLDDYSQGFSEAERRMRKELRRLLKEFVSANQHDE